MLLINTLDLVQESASDIIRWKYGADSISVIIDQSPAWSWTVHTIHEHFRVCIQA